MPEEFNMEKHYNPQAIEDKTYRHWEESGAFTAHRVEGKKPFTIVMPPPNITGQLHMGHAMDCTLQDALTRYHRMKGDPTLWLPGTDHASIATEVKVVEKLAKEGIKKQDIGREEFLKHAWDWKKEYGGRISRQLRRMGASCDWSRERFTMDEGCSRAVREVFVSLYEKGLIYQGNRLINWCPCCNTSISDAEVEYEEKEGNFWHLLYPVKETGEMLELATTRPETMLGDTAVAINPDDPRYKHLHGCHVMLPLINKEIPIVCDEHADMEKGTGVVKITPAHDPNDFQVGLRHDLPIVRVFTYDGHMTGAEDKAAADAVFAAGKNTVNEPHVLDCGKYAGMTTIEARKAIVEDLKAGGYLKEVEPLKHEVGTCYRCHSVIEPMVSKQWFVRMEPLAKPAIESVEKGEIKFVPERFTKNYINWMNDTRDWCISRQLWWGHQIPAWYCQDCDETIVAKEAPCTCPRCGGKNLQQDPDTLDTWFSSALWPFSTLGWPNEDSEDLKFFYPTNTLVTGYDIIGFWVSRMIFSGLAYTGKAPFDTVCVHGIVRDSQGRKMSKSLGNGIDPLEVIDQYGADALRFMLIDGSTPGNDMRYSEEKVKAARNFANKLWNAARFVLMNIPEGFQAGMPAVEDLDMSDKWVLSELNKTARDMTANMDSYDMGLAAAKIQNFIWDVYCDWYIEICKSRLNGGNEKQADVARKVLVYVLDRALRLLHPIMPFVTEEIYQALPGSAETIMNQSWPVFDAEHDWPEECADFEKLMDYIKAVRAARNEMGVHPAKKTTMVIETGAPEAFEKGQAYLAKFAFATEVTLVPKYEGSTDGMVQVATDSARGFIPMMELIDRDKELARLNKEKEKVQKEIDQFTRQLSNEGFVNKAPAQLVEDIRQKLAARQDKIANIEQALAALG